MKARAYSYIRMSTDIQLRGDSLRRQTELSRRYADENGLELVDDFKLEDIGISAFHGRNVAHGALGKFLSLCEQKVIPVGSFLIVESLDRISRQDPQAATSLFLQILQSGIHIVTLTDNHVYRAGSENFTDIIVSVVIMSRAYEESRTKSMRVGAAWEMKRRQAGERKLTTMAPSWLKLSDDRSEFNIIEERVSVVQAMYSDAERGQGSLQIARRLNLQGVPTFSSSKGWHESYIGKILSNRAVIGEFQPHRYVNGKRRPEGDPVPGYYPAIIAPEQFEKVQAGRAIRKIRGAGRKGRANINLFQGVSRCGYCNGRMMVVDKGVGPKGGVYFRCDQARRNSGCNAGSWTLKHLEKSFLWFVEELDVKSLLKDDGLPSKKLTLEGKAARVKADLERQREVREKAFRMLEGTASSISFIMGKIEDASKQIEKLEIELSELRHLIDIENGKAARPIDELKELLKTAGTWEQASEDQRTQVADWIKQNVSELLIYPDGLDGETSAQRQFSVLLSTDEFRTVQLEGQDPMNASYSIFATRDRWVLEENGTKSTYFEVN